MGGPDATPNLWKQLFSAVRASGGYPGNGVVNSPYRVYEQAAAIGEIRNLPTSTVLECSNSDLRQFYALWIGPRERFLTWVNERSENETRMDKLHVIPTLLWIFGSNFSGIFETD